MATIYNNDWTTQQIPGISPMGNNSYNTGFGIANTPNPNYNFNTNIPATSSSPGLIGNIKQGISDFGNRAGQVANNIGTQIANMTEYTPATNYSIIGYYEPTHYWDPTTGQRVPIYDFENSHAGELSLLGAMDRKAQLQAALQKDPFLAQQYAAQQQNMYNNDGFPHYSRSNVTDAEDAEDTGAFGWSKETWRNINTGLELGQLGWNVYSGIQQLSLARQALAEQQLMNAYNRRLSAFNANTQIDQANQSLKDRLYARQKYATGSTAGAEEIYKDRELQHFGG